MLVHLAAQRLLGGKQHGKTSKDVSSQCKSWKVFLAQLVQNGIIVIQVPFDMEQKQLAFLSWQIPCSR